MEKWQLNTLFIVGVGGIILLLVAPAIDGLEAIPKNPTAVSALGLLLTYLFTQRDAVTKDKKKDDEKQKEDEKNGPPAD